MFQGGSLWAGVVSGGVTQFQDTQNLLNGQMERTNYAVKTAGNVTGAVGVMAGIEYGALLGTSIMPGVGTVLGAAAGGLLGDRLGRAVGLQAGNILFNKQAAQNQKQ